jgi:Tol biopolymer transport system component
MRTLHAALSALLLGVGCAAAERADRTPSVDARQVWSGADPDFATGDISSDGRYLSDINWDSGDLQLVDLTTGEVRGATGQGYDAERYAWTSAFSRDGRRLAVSWFVYQANSHELRVMNRDGTDARVLVPAGEDHYYIDPVDWSPSDEDILVAFQLADRTWELRLVSVHDGTMRTLKVLDWQAPGGGHDQAYPDANVSPDGKYVAYDYPPNETERTRDIFAVAVDGGRATTLVSGAGSDRLLGWIPDGGGILFYSDRTGTPGIWRLRVRHAQPIGEPELIRSDLRGVIPVGFTHDAYAYGVLAESEHVVTAAIDPDSGQVLDQPRPVDDSLPQRSLAADWSPDGSRLAYVVFGTFPDPVETLVIRNVDGEVTRTIPLFTALHTSNGTLRWSSEETLFLFGYEHGREGIFQVNLRDGTFRRVLTPATIGRGTIKWFEVGPDGRTLYMIRSPKLEGAESDVLAFDVATGAHRVLGTTRAIPASLAVSPDGKQLAWLALDSTNRTVELRVSTLGNGEARTLHRTPRGRMSPPVAWMPDGSRLLFALQIGDDEPALWSIPTRGGDPVRLLSRCCNENDIRVNRDGRRIAFAAGSSRGELWMLKGY